MLPQHKTVAQLLAAGPGALRAGTVVTVAAAQTGRVVRMPGGWQLRDHQHISSAWTAEVADAAEFLAALKNKFTRAPAQGFTSPQRAGKVSSKLPHGGVAVSGDSQMAQKDMDAVAAGIKAAKQPGAYNGPGVAPHRGVPPASTPLNKAPKPAKGNVKAAKAAPAQPAPKAAPPADSGAGRRGRVASIADTTAISLLETKNPKRVGSDSYARYELYRQSKTVGAYRAAGGSLADLKWDAERNYIALA